MPSRILVVDDDPDILKAIGLRLRLSGFNVSAAQDGVSATQLAMSSRPDVVILDIGMPAGDGHQVCERLRAHPKTCEIPIIYVTARDTGTDRKKAAEMGALAYIVKPFQHQELMATVNRALTPLS